MLALDAIPIEISVVLGQTTMPIHMLLRMGRGAVVKLDTSPADPCLIYADQRLIARGEIVVRDDRVAVSIIETVP